jgi:hypothetical protein
MVLLAAQALRRCHQQVGAIPDREGMQQQRLAARPCPAKAGQKHIKGLLLLRRLQLPSSNASCRRSRSGHPAIRYGIQQGSDALKGVGAAGKGRVVVQLGSKGKLICTRPSQGCLLEVQQLAQRGDASGSEVEEGMVQEVPPRRVDEGVRVAPQR